MSYRADALRHTFRTPTVPGRDDAGLGVTHWWLSSPLRKPIDRDGQGKASERVRNREAFFPLAHG